YRAAYMTLPVMINNVMFGIAPVIAALVADQILVHWETTILAHGLSVNRVIFILRMGLGLLPIFFLRKLSRRHGGRLRQALSEVSGYATTQLQNFYRR
ncbi:MAG: hypothetical protein JXA52_01340, partial [Planctomycetes bacterium]|nr:hypothetical protein [Planctomycetota bacterium]